MMKPVYVVLGLLLGGLMGCEPATPEVAREDSAGQSSEPQIQAVGAKSMETQTQDTPSKPEETKAMSQDKASSAHGHSHDEGDAASTHAHTNRLIDESSPYLLQHAHNPVDWYPWGEEAFELARSLNKPIFLSIGYSTCYWCHVMERESFESEEVAAIMNKLFVCIKVDREERPDVDDIYMGAVQVLTGRGGWPLSVFLEPQGLKPYFGGTYFPPDDSQGRPGFKSMLTQLAAVWETRPNDVVNQANKIAQAVEQNLARPIKVFPLNERMVIGVANEMMSSYDFEMGGYGGAPKFPMSVGLDFLIETAWDRSDVRGSILHTLDRMAMGGMYDQIGGGFHRYSTDAKWLVPHFEKMLYDNGQLATTYAMAYERSQDPYYAEIIREIFEFVQRELTDESGGFYSALDAEVDGREGQNYVWMPEQVEAALQASDQGDLIELTKIAYGLNLGPNFRDPHHPEDGMTHVIHLVDRPDAIAKGQGLELDEFNERLKQANETLLQVRNRRKQPRLDDKIIAGWNGLMIKGYADGGRVLDEQKYIDIAVKAADFVLSEMRDDAGGLLRTHRNGVSKIQAFAEDYALMIRGLLALHQATMDSRWLDEAVQLAGLMRDRFWNEVNGGYFDTLPDQSDLFVRTKSSYDGAMPCANSAMLNNLLELYEATGDERFLNDAQKSLESFSAVIARQPRGPIMATKALHRFIENYPERVLPQDEIPVAVDSPTSPDSPARQEFGDAAVTAWVDQARMELAQDEQITLLLTLEIKKGYHINAHEPGIDFLIPLKVSLQDASGLLFEVEYPQSEAYEAKAIAEEPMKVHTGTIEIPIRIQRNGPVTGTPMITVTWQACTDQACLMPSTETVPLTIVGK
ncbi:MAG: DUF255 domain-containing protein [Planctomycetota bacterium]|nr:DUF255 domain-containing protein [Planctomycetota bacterium]